jgi:CheY-like chemotaxis protein
MGLVLVVDDDRMVVGFLGRVLGERGYDVITAADGCEVRPLLERFAVDLVVVDLQMPGVNGWEVIRHLRDRFHEAFPGGPPDVRIVAVSERADPETAAFALRLGADAFVPKPVRPIEFLRVVELLGVPPARVAGGPMDTSASARP